MNAKITPEDMAAARRRAGLAPVQQAMLRALTDWYNQNVDRFGDDGDDE